MKPVLGHSVNDEGLLREGLYRLKKITSLKKRSRLRKKEGESTVNKV